MKIWFSSDWHLGHKNIIKYCDRPFDNIEEMNKVILEYYNTIVGPNDVFYHLGDFALNKKFAIDYVSKMNGHKVLISGNHDATFSGHKKYQKAVEEYKNAGWTDVKQELQIALKNDRVVLLSHLPYLKEGHDKRYLNMRPQDQGLFLLHGHLHGWYKKSNNMIDVGLDAHDGQILSEDDVIELINDERDYIESSLTKFNEEKNND